MPKGMNSRDLIGLLNAAAPGRGNYRARVTFDIPARFGSDVIDLHFGTATIKANVLERKLGIMGNPVTKVRVWHDEAVAELEKHGLLSRTAPGSMPTSEPAPSEA